MVGFAYYNSGDRAAGIEGLDVLYEIQGHDEVTAVEHRVGVLPRRPGGQRRLR